MIPALRWAAMRAIFNISVGSDGQSHKTVSTNRNLFEEKGEPKHSKGFLSPTSQILSLCEHTCCFVVAGGHSEDHEDAQEDHQCGTADGAGGDPEEHVPALQEADQGAD